MIDSINSGINDVLKFVGPSGVKLDKVGELAKLKGLDGSFADKLGSILGKYDKNGDKSLSQTEVKAAFGDLKSKFGIGNAGVDIEQLKAFKSAAEKNGITNTPMLDGIISGFNSFDSDHSGKLSTKELKSAINTYKALVQA